MAAEGSCKKVSKKLRSVKKNYSLYIFSGVDPGSSPPYNIDTFLCGLWLSLLSELRWDLGRGL
jgi:hypothetical protein